MTALCDVSTQLTVLSENHLWCLANCHSYEKYWWYRTLFEAGKCPLCSLPKEIYPPLIDNNGHVYTNNHWTVVVDTLAEKEFRTQTLLLIFNEHVGGFDWNSMYSAVDLQRIKVHLELYLESHFGEAHGGFVSRIGNGKHTVDTVPSHYSETFIIPDENGSVLAPIFKGPERQKFIRERAMGFSTRYEAGEVPA